MEESELERAKAYLKDLEKYKKPKMNLGTYNLGDGKWHMVNRTCYEHMRACVRFLEFLEDYVKGLDAVPVKISVKHKDFLQTIKLYASREIK